MDRTWVDEAIRKIDRDFQRSADTHLVRVDLPGLPGIDLYLTASAEAKPSRHNGATFDSHALELQAPAAGLSDSRRQQWFFESYPNAFDQSAPLFGNGVRIWNRETRSVICFDPPYGGSFLFSRVNANEGRHSHWFVSMVP